MELRFTKMHGLGNDFLVVDDREEVWDFQPDAVRWLCDRHFGVGADGMVIVRPAEEPEAHYRMVIINADGSRAEMCGNGVRCFAKWLVDRELIEGDVLGVETDGGVRRVDVERGGDGLVARARVDMGVPRLKPSEIPADFPGEQVFECAIETELGQVQLTAVSMGNPHAVIWVDDVESAPVETLGPLVETHPAFPERTNVEFAELVKGETDRIRVRVWERGVGETLACGTGACAALVAATLSCRVGREATIELPGGELFVTWPSDGSVYMTGAAEQVFEGVIEVDDEG